MRDQILTNKEFFGKIIPRSAKGYYDLNLQGRYKVYIPELMPHITDDNGIYCKNHTHKLRITGSDDGEYGQYFPLHPGTYVIVKFQSNDFNTGYIDRIISDQREKSNVEAQDCITAIPTELDRDEQTIIFKTPKKNNSFYINEETKNEPNTIYLIFNRDSQSKRRTVFRVDESGITTWTRDNNRIRILLDDNKQVDGTKTEYIKKDKNTVIDNNETKHVKQNVDLRISGNNTIQILGTKNLTVNGDCNVFSSSSINCDAPVINLNCGIASNTPANPKVKQPVRDLGPNETPEYDDSTSVGDKCDDATESYNVGARSENETM